MHPTQRPPHHHIVLPDDKNISSSLDLVFIAARVSAPPGKVHSLNTRDRKHPGSTTIIRIGDRCKSGKSCCTVPVFMRAIITKSKSSQRAEKWFLGL